MKNLCEIGVEIASEFGYTEDQVCALMRPEGPIREETSQFTSLLDDPEFNRIEERSNEIRQILATNRLSENTTNFPLSDQDMKIITDDPQLTERLLSIFEEAVVNDPMGISGEFERRIGKFSEAFAQLKLISELAQLTRISIRWLLVTSPDSRGEVVVLLGLVHLCRYYDMLNEDCRVSLLNYVEDLFKNPDIIRDLENYKGHTSALSRWKLIQRESRVMN